jgi:hypothetical protein
MAEQDAYAKVMGAVEKVQPARVDEFQGWCQYFGSAPNEEAEVKAKEFYEYLTTAFGPAFAEGLAPDLAQLIPDETKKTLLLKQAGIDYVSPTTLAGMGSGAPAQPGVDPSTDPMAFLASQQDESVALTPEEEAALKEKEEAKAAAAAEAAAQLEHESVEGLTGSVLAAAEARNAEKDVVKDLQGGKTSMWDMTKMGE